MSGGPIQFVQSVGRPLFFVVRLVVFALAAVTGLAILAMMVVTCADVVGRAANHPVTGALDIVKVCSALAIAGALPYTTAVKGHVAIEYFFHKLGRRSRIVVDSLARLAGATLFVVLTRQLLLYGQSLRQSGQVTVTLQMPLFWVPQFIAFCCGMVVLVILYNLLHPGKEMIRP